MKHILTNVQLAQIEKEIESFPITKTDLKGEYTYFSHIDYLISKKVYARDEFGTPTILVYEGMGASKVPTGFGFDYDTDIPYDFWQDALGQLDKYLHKKEFAKRKQVEEFEKV